MARNFKATWTAYGVIQSIAALAAVISTLAALFSFFPSTEEMSTAVIHALRSDAKPVASYRSIPIKAADGRESPDQVLLLHNRKSSMQPISVTALTPLQQEQQSGSPESSETTNKEWPMKDWGKIISLEADQLGLDHFVHGGGMVEGEAWQTFGSGEEHREVKPVLAYRSAEESASQTAVTIDESGSTRLLITPIWKIERFRIVTILNTLVFLATVGLCCLVAYEATQFLKRGSQAEPDELQGGDQGSKEPEEKALAEAPQEDEAHLLKVLTRDPLQPNQAS